MKNLKTLLAIVLSASLYSFADDTYDDAPSQCFPTGFYIGGAIGGVNNPWEDYASPVGGPSTAVTEPKWTNGNWALSAGGFLGYQFTENFSFEMGGFWFNTVRIQQTIQAITTLQTIDIDMKINNLYALFAAVGVQAPIGPVYLNMKLGLGYQHVGVENAPASNAFFHSFHDDQTFGPMLGAALLYPWCQNVFGLRYDRFAGDVDHHTGKYVLDTNVITATYAYYF